VTKKSVKKSTTKKSSIKSAAKTTAKKSVKKAATKKTATTVAAVKKSAVKKTAAKIEDASIKKSAKKSAAKTSKTKVASKISAKKASEKSETKKSVTKKTIAKAADTKSETITPKVATKKSASKGTSKKAVSKKSTKKDLAPESKKAIEVSTNIPAEAEGFVLKVKAEFKTFDEILESRKFLKVSSLIEQDEIEERANKKKYSESKLPEYPTRSMRSKEHKLEETPEELIARIARELDDERSVSSLDQNEMQLCTKCGMLPVADRFRVDRDLGYCEICAELLGLGESKEARKEAVEGGNSNNAAF
jgi:hypothetical protein